VNVRGRDAIDCDVHANVPAIEVLVPYLDDYWRDMVEVRGMGGFESRSYPPQAPLSCRPDWRTPSGRPADDLATLRTQVLDHWQTRVAILNCLYGVQLIMDEHLAAAFASAVNDWLLKEWLEPEPRLRASIVVTPQNPACAVSEIERRAQDPRFVQVLLLATGEMPLGRSAYWPIYEAAERHALPIGIHAGSSYRHPVTSVGWPSFHVEDYVAQTQGFQAQLASLVAEGVFAKFPKLKVVLLESGVTWLPGFMWRFSKFWRGLRAEVPWVDRSPAEIVRDHVRLTIQPLDSPPDSADLERVLEHIGSDEVLLYASDFPHWHFEGDDTVPEGVPAALLDRVLVDNPLATYTRLAANPGLGGPS
jgi:predicted TIM-barrel fold metal-dependent hydrolase